MKFYVFLNQKLDLLILILFPVNYYPKSALDKFEYYQILELIINHCISPMGKKITEDLLPFDDFNRIKRHLFITNEFIAILKQQLSFPTDGYFPVSHFLNRLSKDNYTGEKEQFVAIREIVKAVKSINQFLKVKEEEDLKFPLIKALVKQLPYEKEIIDYINEVLTPDGKIKNNASPVLAIIRQEQTSTQREIEKVFQRAINSYRKLNYLADTQETIRHGRRVLAVKSEFKRKIKGVVHDISETGQTAYIEPNAALQLSNELLNLEQDERAEIHKILKELTASIQPYIPLIARYEQLLGRLDFSRAKAKLAIQLNALVPQLNEAPIIMLKQAYHPLLKLQNDKANKPTIPLDIDLNKEQRIIVISGPNAGGKSVSLKTIGLLQLMLQSGIPVPVADNSVMGVFTQLLTEIGDEQSIENELSTYSSKLKHMKYFLEYANKKSLFLIDEFGSGTDPNLGGAVAQAILEELNNKKSYGIITTHYLNLKTFANVTEGIENAAMLFNEDSLQPLYQLKTGKPGSSYTFSIAKTSGLSDKLVQRAKQISSNSQVKLEELLTDTQQSQSNIAIQQLEIDSKKRELTKKEKEVEQLKKKLQNQKQNYTINKKEEELKLKTEVKRQVEDYIKQLKAVENKEKASQKIREKLNNEVSTTKGLLQKKVRQKAIAEVKVKTRPLKVGDKVLWLTNNQTGELLEIKNKKAEVALGGLRTTIPITDLILAGSIDKTKNITPIKSASVSTKPIPDNFRFEIDIRGKRFEEAEKELTDFLDQAILANASWLRVLHGKGSGVLRKLTHDIAKRYNAIEISHPSFENGGDGISIIQF